MNIVAKPRQRRRMVLTCIECRKRKQKCDRAHPCMQCVARGSEDLCIYEKYKNPNAGIISTAGGSPKALPASETTRSEHVTSSEAPVLLRHAQDYGYSNSDTLGSMAMLSKVIDGIDVDISSSHPATKLRVQSRIRTQYYGFVRRLPRRRHCELLFSSFFSGVNTLTAALDETMFREQAERWWSSANEILLTQGPEGLPSDLPCFPALMFQIFALALPSLPPSYDPQIDELKFAPSQTFPELSSEYSECGEALSKLLAGDTPTLTTVQHGLLRSQYLINVGELMKGWTQSGLNVKLGMSIGLHLEPQLPPSSQAEQLLDALWKNELRKRTWLNLFLWDQSMAIPLGQPFFINSKECTVTPPTECDVPTDRLKRVPVARSESEKPSIVTERIIRNQISIRLHEIRELEVDGPIPKDPEKVKDLHHFALNWKKNLPAFFQTSNPDTKWDEELPFVPTQREMLSYLFDAFLMALHRPYIFTREKSQRQVYESSLAILESQDRLFGFFREKQKQWFIATTFPTFDAAVLLAVILVSYPEQYHARFQQPYQKLKNAYERLRVMGLTLPLANTGADILQTTMRRVVEAQERAGFATNVNVASAPGPTPSPQVKLHSISSTSSNTSADGEPWSFEPNPSAMDWTVQDPNFAEFDFSNLDVPMPLKELFWDEELSIQADAEVFDNSGLWAEAPEQQAWTGVPPGVVDFNMDPGENPLWNFLARYPSSSGVPKV